MNKDECQHMTDRPTPFVSKEIDLRKMPGFVLDVERLLASELLALATPEEFAAAIMLWCRAWQQVPHGSLPNDERALAGFSCAKNWKKVRDMALRGFVLCSDGRLYHPLLCEKVHEAWRARQKSVSKREKDNIRLAEWREKKRTKNQAETDQNELLNSDETDYETQYETRFELCSKPLRSRSRSRSRSEVNQNQGGQAAATISAREADHTFAAPPPDTITGRAIELTALLRKRGAALQASDPRIRAWAESGVTDAQALAALETAQQRRHDRNDPAPINAGYLDAIIKGSGARASPAGETKEAALERQNKAAAAQALAEIMEGKND